MKSGCPSFYVQGLRRIGYFYKVGMSSKGMKEAGLPQVMLYPQLTCKLVKL